METAAIDLNPSLFEGCRSMQMLLHSTLVPPQNNEVIQGLSLIGAQLKEAGFVLGSGHATVYIHADCLLIQGVLCWPATSSISFLQRAAYSATSI